MKWKKGLTVEGGLVIVIVMILMAMMFSKIVELQRQARAAKVNEIRVAIKAAAVITKAVCLVEMASSARPTCTNVAGTVNVDGVSVTMRNQYPEANMTATGILGAAGIRPDRDGVAITVVKTGGDPVLKLAVNGAVENCGVTYQAPDVAGESMVVVATTTGC